MKTYAILLSAALLIPASGARAQVTLPCETASLNSWCEIREFTLPFSGVLDAETAVGSISVKGWDDAYVLLRARVSSNANSEWEARAIAAAVEIETTAEQVRARGPLGGSWGLSYELYVPRRIGLDLRTRVGSITIAGVSGHIRLETSVGAIVLSATGGDIHARTGVGAISIALDGDHWDGGGLSAVTGTGAIHVSMPAAYSAHFDLRTSLGGLATNVPGVRPGAAGFLGRRLIFDAGTGGAVIQAVTSVGQIDLVQR